VIKYTSFYDIVFTCLRNSSLRLIRHFFLIPLRWRIRQAWVKQLRTWNVFFITMQFIFWRSVFYSYHCISVSQLVWETKMHEWTHFLLAKVEGWSCIIGSSCLTYNSTHHLAVMYDFNTAHKQDSDSGLHEKLTSNYTCLQTRRSSKWIKSNVYSFRSEIPVYKQCCTID